MKKKIVAMALVLSMVFAYCLSNLNLPVQAEEGTADFDQQIQKANNLLISAETKSITQLKENTKSIIIKIRMY